MFHIVKMYELQTSDVCTLQCVCYTNIKKLKNKIKEIIRLT